MGITSDILTISLIIFPILAAYINPRITLSMRWQFKLDSIIRRVDSTVPKIFCALYIIIDLVGVLYSYLGILESNIITEEELDQVYHDIGDSYYCRPGILYLYHRACELLVHIIVRSI